MANNIDPLEFVACSDNGCNRYTVDGIVVNEPSNGRVQVDYVFNGLRTLSTAAESTLEIKNRTNNDTRTVESSQYTFTNERGGSVTLQGSPGDEIVVTLTGSNGDEISNSPDSGSALVPSPFDPSAVVRESCGPTQSVVREDGTVEIVATYTNTSDVAASVRVFGSVGSAEFEQTEEMAAGETVEFVFEADAGAFPVGEEQEISADAEVSAA